MGKATKEHSKTCIKKKSSNWTRKKIIQKKFSGRTFKTNPTTTSRTRKN